MNANRILLLLFLACLVHQATAQPSCQWYAFNPEPPQDSIYTDLFQLSTCALDGSRMAVGYSATGNESQVHIYDTSTHSLVTTIDDPTGSANDHIGNAIALSGTRLMIGSWTSDTGATDAGSVYFYSALTGAHLRTIHNPEPDTTDSFGASVKIDGTYAFIGSPRDAYSTFRTGRVFLFDASTGIELRRFENPTPDSGDWFGDHLAIFGNLVAISASMNDSSEINSGVVYLFNRDSGALLHTFYDPTADLNERFGQGIALSANYLFVCSRDNANGVVHQFDAQTGTLIRTIAEPAAYPVEFFAPVGVSGNNLVIGSSSGLSFVFDADTANLRKVLHGDMWSLDISNSDVLIHGNINYAVLFRCTENSVSAWRHYE